MNRKKNTKLFRFLRFLTLTILILTGVYSIALAAPPLSGLVVEGMEAPGAALGDTRDEVTTSYGAPSFCQGPTQSFCTYTITDVGTINIWYEGPDGGEATGTGADVMFALSWYGLENWVTTAGINTAIALDDPDAVIAAYPNGEVTYYQSGHIFKVRDSVLGIEVKWNVDFYTGLVYTNLQIFEGAVTPPPPPPPPDDLVRVSDISMALAGRNITALVQMTDQNGNAVSGATVEATWTFPNGSTAMLTGVSNGNGQVTFTVQKAKGTHTLTITNVSLTGFTFDPDNSVLMQSLTVGGGGRP